MRRPSAASQPRLSPPVVGNDAERAAAKRNENDDNRCADFYPRASVYLAEVFSTKSSDLVRGEARGRFISLARQRELIVNPGESNGNHVNISGGRRMRRSVRLAGPALHRIGEVMEQEGVSPRSAARQMNVPQAQIYEESHPSCDLRLSALYRWQKILEVPLSDLLNEPERTLSPQVRLRSSLLKAMRTVRTIQERSQEDATQTLAAQLADQLTEMMPELETVPSWPAVGQRRTLDEMGAVVENQMSDLFFTAPHADE
jgi:hypothetical protein